MMCQTREELLTGGGCEEICAGEEELNAKRKNRSRANRRRQSEDWVKKRLNEERKTIDRFSGYPDTGLQYEEEKSISKDVFQ